MGNSLNRALGLALIVIGVGLAYWGYQIAETLPSQLSTKFSGTLPTEVITPLYRRCSLRGCRAVLNIKRVARHPAALKTRSEK